MLGPDWNGNLDAVLDAVAAAGYDGIEVTNRTIGAYRDDGAGFARALAGRTLRLSAIALSVPSGWTVPESQEDDLAEVARWTSFLQQFPGVPLALGGATSHQPAGTAAVFASACRLYNDVGALGYRAGVPVLVHPTSHGASILQTADEYARLLDALDPTTVHFGPDTGHMLAGGQDVVAQVERYLPRIRQLHVKDARRDGTWAPFGHGDLDIDGLLRLLVASGFDGWLTIEEEDDSARADPAAAVARARQELERAWARILPDHPGGASPLREGSATDSRTSVQVP